MSILTPPEGAWGLKEILQKSNPPVVCLSDCDKCVCVCVCAFVLGVGEVELPQRQHCLADGAVSLALTVCSHACGNSPLKSGGSCIIYGPGRACVCVYLGVCVYVCSFVCVYVCVC